MKLKRWRASNYSMAIIKLYHVTKCYGDTKAVNDISLTIHQGEIYGLLGENGAGKTTLLRIITGLIEPTDGTYTINGGEIKPKSIEAKRYLGFVTTDARPLPDLTVQENLALFGSFFYKDKIQLHSRIQEIISDLELQPHINKRVDVLSTGNKQKVAIARVLIGDPEILILDEPMNGLDVSTQQKIKQLIMQLKEQGKTIVFTSHNMNEIAELTERIGVIQKGSLIFEGPIQHLTYEQRVPFLEGLLVDGGDQQ